MYVILQCLNFIKFCQPLRNNERQVLFSFEEMLNLSNPLLLFLDCLSLSIFFCLILALFAKTKNNTTGNIQSPDISNSVPDFHVFNWRLCKVLNY